MTAADGLKVQLEAACEDLWWSSESDYPVEVVWSVKTTAAQDSDALRDWLLGSISKIENPDALVAVDVEDFFERAIAPKSWHTSEDTAQMNQLRQLKELLVRSLQNLSVYRYGEVEILVYVLGYTPTGHLAGVKTCLIET